MGGELCILGAGGHGRVVADCAEALGWRSVRFFDDHQTGLAAGRWPVAGRVDDLVACAAGTELIIAIGRNDVRLDLHRRFAGLGSSLVTLIHPRATVSRYAHVGAGSVVLAGAVVNIGAEIGEACIVNTASSIDHDCRLGDGVHVSPGAHLAGTVVVGGCSWIGVGASIRDGVSVGRNVRVGAGAVLVTSTDNDVDMIGVPAKPRTRSRDA